jgi:hypothetical protein
MTTKYTLSDSYWTSEAFDLSELSEHLNSYIKDCVDDEALRDSGLAVLSAFSGVYDLERCENLVLNVSYAIGAGHNGLVLNEVSE